MRELMRHGAMDFLAGAAIPVALIEELCAHVPTMHSPGPSTSKPYLVQWLGRYPKYDKDSIWARIELALRPIAAEYLDAKPRLHFYNLWESLPMQQAPRDSQLWHQDQEDKRLLKAFLYLTDVTPEAGPLMYIPGTHWRGAKRLRPPITLMPMPGLVHPVRRVLDEDMRVCAPESDWQTFVVPKGTLVLADTTGWHKGGHATTQRRLCAVWEWTTQQSPVRSRMR